MTDSRPRVPSRSIALSRERIVEATIELLDSSGEAALTVRSLTAHLSTGRGAIYHYVTGKDELLAAATDAIITAVFQDAPADSNPRHSIRMLAGGMFDALTAHPWVGTQLGHEPMQAAVLRIWKGLGIHLQHWGLPHDSRSNAGAALLNYLLGAAAQYAATAGKSDAGARKAYLESLAEELLQSDSDALTRDTAASIAAHDDREQFLAGIDIFLGGIEAAQESRAAGPRN